MRNKLFVALSAVTVGFLAFTAPAQAFHYNHGATFAFGEDDPPAYGQQSRSHRQWNQRKQKTRRNQPRVRRGRVRPTRHLISFRSKFKPGTILINTSRRKLHLVLANNKAMEYGVGVGRLGFQWTGRHTVTRKAEWPSWRPPAEMRIREKRLYGRTLPTVMKGGPKNPLGARALYIGSTLYRIHGTNEAHTIGRAVSSGCIRMLNSDVMDLYQRVNVGAKVVVTM